MNPVRQSITRFVNDQYCKDLLEYFNFSTSEPDEFSHSAIHAAAFQGEEIVGTIRLILGPDNHVTRLIPGIQGIGPEISRVVVKRTHRGDHRIMIRLIREACLLALEYQHDVVCCMIHAPLYKLIMAMGYKFNKVLEEPVTDYGQEQYVVSFRPDDVMDLMALHSRGSEDLAIKRVYPEKRKVALETTAWL